MSARLGAAAGLLASLVGAAHARMPPGLCDILERAGTPCVAAHSTTRALYAGYDGRLYQVRRDDGQVRDIGPITPGGVADAGAQDGFCAHAACVITRIYDQSPRHNDLTIEGRGGAGGPDRGAAADALPVTLAGRRVYGLFIEAGMGYRDDDARGTARDGQPETMLMVTSGLHANAGCCFDYGNAERSNTDTGNGHMDALNFSLMCGHRICAGRGPWVQADLENGLFMSASGGNQESAYRGNASAFVTALLKNNGRDFFALSAGDAQQGALSPIWSGAEPSRPGYSPLHQEGAIVLGTGGDNSNQSVGSFFEGVMIAGVTATQTDDAVQANIVAAGYGGLGGAGAGKRAAPARGP